MTQRWWKLVLIYWSISYLWRWFRLCYTRSSTISRRRMASDDPRHPIHTIHHSYWWTLLSSAGILFSVSPSVLDWALFIISNGDDPPDHDTIWSRDGAPIYRYICGHINSIQEIMNTITAAPWYLSIESCEASRPRIETGTINKTVID